MYNVLWFEDEDYKFQTFKELAEAKGFALFPVGVRRKGINELKLHQGKYDALAILRNMDDIPCAPLWELKAADRILAHEMAYLVNAVLIDLESMKGKAKGIVDAIEQIKTGSNMLIFPEGKTNPDKGNALGEFQSGCFACSLKTKTTIVPVAIYDSYKAMNGNDVFARVTAQVHFLDPIRYDEYKDLNKQELCELVKNRIQAKLDEIERA